MAGSRIFSVLAVAILVAAGVAACAHREVAHTLPIVASASPSANAAAVCPDVAGPPPQGDVPPDTQRSGPVPPGFKVAWVLRCTTEARALPGKGEWQVLVSERADTSAAALLVALAPVPVPYQRRPCPMYRVNVPYFALVDTAGKIFTPGVPVDSCGHPLPAALAALKALPFREFSVRPLRQLESPDAQAAGCNQDYKDELSIDGLGFRSAPARPVWATATTISACVYGGITIDGVPTGHFQSSRTLTGSAAKALMTALNQAPAAAACATKNTRFAVLTADKTQPATAELDGCHRLLRPDNTLGQLTAAVTAQLG
jgi:hypothetical protein